MLTLQSAIEIAYPHGTVYTCPQCKGQRKVGDLHECEDTRPRLHAIGSLVWFLDGNMIHEAEVIAFDGQCYEIRGQWGRCIKWGSEIHSQDEWGKRMLRAEIELHILSLTKQLEVLECR